jgi:hypothetical protein
MNAPKGIKDAQSGQTGNRTRRPPKSWRELPVKPRVVSPRARPAKILELIGRPKCYAEVTLSPAQLIASPGATSDSATI